MAILAWLIYQIFLYACDRLTSVVVTFVFLSIFGFSQYLWIGNYNFVTPYRHEQTHGTALSIAIIFCFARYFQSKKNSWLTLAGLFFGLLSLTRIELMLASLASIGIGLTLFFCRSISLNNLKRISKLIIYFATTALIPVILSVLLLSLKMPLSVATRTIFNNFVLPFKMNFSSLPFYQLVMGLDRPKENFELMIRIFAAILIAIGIAAGLDYVLRKLTDRRLIISLLTGGVTFWLITIIPIPWMDIARPLPLISIIIVIAIAIINIKQYENGEKLIVLAMLGTLSSVLLIKMVLNARISHYGFYIALPGTLLFTSCLVWMIPSSLQYFKSRGDIARAISIAMVIAGIIYYIQYSNFIYEQKNYRIGNGEDAIITYNQIADPRLDVIESVMKDLQTRIAPGQTLAVLPEGIMVNYQLRLTNPTPYTTIEPVTILTYGGEEQMVKRMDSKPPDFILLLDRDMSEHKVGRFGVDPKYGRQIMNWVRQNYTQIKVYGDQPFIGQQYGAAILKRIKPD